MFVARFDVLIRLFVECARLTVDAYGIETPLELQVLMTSLEMIDLPTAMGGERFVRRNITEMQDAIRLQEVLVS